MRGSIQRTGSKRYRITLELGRDPETGERIQRRVRFKGARKEAEAEKRRLLDQYEMRYPGGYAAGASSLDPENVTVDEFFQAWFLQIKPTVSAQTFEGYKLKYTPHIKPVLGSKRLKEIQPYHIDQLYTFLLTEGRKDGQEGGLAPRTVRHIHRVFKRALKKAVAWRLIFDNPADHADAPKVKDNAECKHYEREELPIYLEALEGTPYFHMVFLASCTGLRRGELLALRWRNIDFEKNTLFVEEVLEQTKEHGIRFKEPKTELSRRTITLPLLAIEMLQRHMAEQNEWLLGLGVGRNGETLLFPTISRKGELTPRSPRAVSRELSKVVKALGIKAAPLHGLRHTNITMMLTDGVPLKMVSKRAGHSRTSTTLNIYSHCFQDADDGAADLVDTSMRKALGERTSNKTE
jgi:integrase